MQIGQPILVSHTRIRQVAAVVSVQLREPVLLTSRLCCCPWSMMLRLGTHSSCCQSLSDTSCFHESLFGCMVADGARGRLVDSDKGGACIDHSGSVVVEAVMASIDAALFDAAL